MEKLPEKWCIKDCDIVTEFAVNTFNCYNRVTKDYMHINQSEFPNDQCYKFKKEIQKGYTEITLEQFKKLVLKNNNMENRMKITPPEGWEIDVEKSNLQTGEIIYKEKVKEKQLPKTWEELENISGYYITTNSEIFRFPTCHISDNQKNIVKTESQAKALLALSQLLYLRDEYNGDWKPDWTDAVNIKHCIFCDEDKITRGGYYHKQKVMAFKTAELSVKFYDNFKDLLETAKELL